MLTVVTLTNNSDLVSIFLLPLYLHRIYTHDITKSSNKFLSSRINKSMLMPIPYSMTTNQ
jgi:hypothetical protein